MGCLTRTIHTLFIHVYSYSPQSALEEAKKAHQSDQDPTSSPAHQDQATHLLAQLGESKKRMNRYRDERNTARIMLKSLQEQILTLQNTVQQLQESKELYANKLEKALLTKLQLTDDVTDYNPEGPQTGLIHLRCREEEEEGQVLQGDKGGSLCQL